MVQIREAGRKIKWPELSELEGMILKSSQKKVAVELGVSCTSVNKHLKRERLRIGTGFAPKTPSCRDCGVDFDGTNTYKARKIATYCKVCANKRKIESLRQKKRDMVDYLGGECARCGYRKYVGALHIHHKDPTIKDENFRHARGWSWARIEKELQNCELLCANCHAEEHAEEYYAGLV